tara:strand:- start:432 stop:626 length:195 start_codon:yes stop_codon:yes gene_type:complete
MKKVQTNSMFNSDLTPMFDGCVMMNESAKHDQAVMNVLEELQADQFRFKSIGGEHVTFDQFIGR